MADFDITLPALPERVWQALTDPARLAVWFMDNDFRPELGHRFTLRPQGLAGVDGPIHGDVLQFEPSRQIGMSWEYAGTRAMVTWLIEPGQGGTRLRVTHVGHLGSPAARAIQTETFQHLYGQRLRALLSGGMLSQVGPAAAAPARPAGAGTAETRDTLPLRRPGLRRQSVVWLAGCAALLIGLGAATWQLAPVPASPTNPLADLSSPPGVGVLGTAEPSRPTGPPNSRAVQPPASMGPSASANANAAGSPEATVDGQPAGSPPAPEAGPIGITFKETPRGLLELVVEVTLTNPGPGAATWTNVAARVAGVNLAAASSTPSVTYSWKAPLACFTPTADFAKVPAANPVTFSFTVSGVGTDVQSVLLDQPGCA